MLLASLLQVTINFTDEADRAGLVGEGTSFGGWLGSLLGAIMVIAALMLLLYLVWGAFEWITSGGDSSKVQKARDKMTQAVIGIVVLASTVAIFSLIQNFLGIEVLRVLGPTNNNYNSAVRNSSNFGH